MALKEPIYKGNFLPPATCTDKQLEAICIYFSDYLEWCLDADGRVNKYDRACDRYEPYMNEQTSRETSPEVKKKKKKAMNNLYFNCGELATIMTALNDLSSHMDYSEIDETTGKEKAFLDSAYSKILNEQEKRNET